MSGNMDEIVKNRLIKFLLKDKIGIRKSLLDLFLLDKSCTTGECYDHLIKQGFNVNYKGVSALIGQMHSRLGILHIYLTEEHNVYSLKEDHWDIVNMALNNQPVGPQEERKGANAAEKCPLLRPVS